MQSTSETVQSSSETDIRICGPRGLSLPELMVSDGFGARGLAYVFGTDFRLVEGWCDCQFQKTSARVQKCAALDTSQVI